ncbi:hypothetical protein MOUN0_J09912 [Monosporozyma unispora]
MLQHLYQRKNMDWEICNGLIEMTIISGNIQNSNISEKLFLLYKLFFCLTNRPRWRNFCCSRIVLLSRA